MAGTVAGRQLRRLERPEANLDTDPYYLPSDVLNSALQVAALAGIDVRLMLPARSDSKVVDLASHSYLDDMMKAGVKILFYKPGFLHSKLLIIDNS